MGKVARLTFLGIALVGYGPGGALAAADFFPDSSTTYIAPSDLGNLDCYGLWHARNEIFARLHYRFKTAKAQAEFGTTGYVDYPNFNPYESKNIALIQQYEKAGYCG